MRIVTDEFWSRWNFGNAFVGDDAPNIRLTVEPGWMLRDSSQLAETQTVIIRPNATVLNASWTGTHANTADDSDATYMQSTAAFGLLKLGFGTYTTPAGAQIFSVRPRIRAAWVGTPTDKLFYSLAVNGITANQSPAVLTTAIRTYDGEPVLTSPESGLAWTQDDINNLEMWILGGSVAPGISQRAYEAYIEIIYTFDPVLSSGTLGTFKKGPIRYFQNCDNSRTELEVPNVASLNENFSLDQDAATCEITLFNQRMHNNGSIAQDDQELGQPGYYTWERGKTADAQAKWGHTKNEWFGLLVPNALLRSYGGYGGRDKTIAQAIEDGNIIQTGTWLVDSVRIQTDGRLSLACRDMGKLLIEQYIYPPLVPSTDYPDAIDYCRWITQTHTQEAIPYGQKLSDAGFSPISLAYRNSGSDVWFGPDAQVHGHKPTQTLDGNIDSFWLSVGNSTPEQPFAVEWIEYDVSGDLNAVALRPWGGNYTTFISVMENGVWQGVDTIDYAPLDIGKYGDDQGENAASINYVERFGLPWEVETFHVLPRTYQAQRLRISITDLTRSQWGPYYYRGGLREVRAGLHNNQPTYDKIITGIDTHAAFSQGYWLVGSDGGVFTFGEAPFYGSQGSLPEAGVMIGMAINGGTGFTGGSGYWLGGSDGGIFAFGAANFHDSLPGLSIVRDDIIAIETSQIGDGYYLAAEDGDVFAFGDATYHGNFILAGFPVVGMAVKKAGSAGYWLIDSDGFVQAMSGAAHFGDVSTLMLNQPVTGIVATATGLGYWITAGDGGVFAFGDAVYYGSIGFTLNNPMTDMVPTSSGAGYWLVAEDGGVFAFGDAQFYGSLPGAFDITIRQNGNYIDYSDVLKELLLWAGFWCKVDEVPANEFPGGVWAIENTGAYNNAGEGCLPIEWFDKHPVIDPIKEIAQIVGYETWVDELGRFHFQAPNIWAIQNFLEDGTETSHIPLIDERQQLTNYSMEFNDRPIRSQIIISSNDPTADLDTTITTTTVPQNADVLKGIVKIALWVNENFMDKLEQETLADLIGLRTWLAQRTGSVTCVANPAIQIDDQVRIMERQTSEVAIHYVTGISRDYDAVTGRYMMTLTTHWLGDGDSWALNYTGITE